MVTTQRSTGPTRGGGPEAHVSLIGNALPKPHSTSRVVRYALAAVKPRVSTATATATPASPFRPTAAQNQQCPQVCARPRRPQGTRRPPHMLEVVLSLFWLPLWAEHTPPATPLPCNSTPPPPPLPPRCTPAWPILRLIRTELMEGSMRHFSFADRETVTAGSSSSGLSCTSISGLFWRSMCWSGNVWMQSAGAKAARILSVYGFNERAMAIWCYYMELGLLLRSTLTVMSMNGVITLV